MTAPTAMAKAYRNQQLFQFEFFPPCNPPFFTFSKYLINVQFACLLYTPRRLSDCRGRRRRAQFLLKQGGTHERSPGPVIQHGVDAREAVDAPPATQTLASLHAAGNAGTAFSPSTTWR